MTRMSMIVHGAGAVVGAVLGYVYYAKVGCVNGHCMIWANPWIAIGYGGLLGYLITGVFPIGKKKDKKESAESPSQ